MKKTLKSLFTIIASFVVLFASCNLETSSTKVEYKVSHYIQNAADDEYTLYDTESFKGFVGEAATAEPLALDGFSALSFEKPKIKKGLNITIKYDRKTVRNTFNFDGGTVTNLDGTVIESVTLTGRYGAEINFPKPEKKGYVLEAWYDADGNEAPSTFTNDNSFIAGYVTKTQANYTVHHFFQNIENDDYTEDETLKENTSGLTATYTEAVAKALTGFTPISFTQQIIKSDDSTEVNIFYNRNLITYTFNLSGGEGIESITKKYGTAVSVPEPTKKGSVSFSGWNPDLPGNFTEDATFTAVYGLPSYTVKYSFENLSDDGFSSDIAYPDETYVGNVGEMTNVKAKNIKGFIPLQIEQKEIKDNTTDKSITTEIEVKYKRKTITLYIDLQKATGTSYIQGKYCKESEKEESHALIESQLEYLATNARPERTGFTFNGYEYSDDLCFSIESDEKKGMIKTLWKGGVKTYYNIKVYQENLNYSKENDKYTLYKIIPYVGLSGEKAVIEGNISEDTITIKGFESISGDENLTFPGLKLVQFDGPKEVEGDESTTMNVYFDRKIITYNFDLNGGTVNGSSTVDSVTDKYDAKIILPNPIKPGYEYVWKNENSEIVTSNHFLPDSQNLKAIWSPVEVDVTFHNRTQSKNMKQSFFSTFDTTVDSISEQNHTLSGWSRNSDCSTLDFKVGDEFKLSDQEMLDIRKMDLYAIWDIRYKVRHYQENENGKFDLIGIDNITEPYLNNLNGYIEPFEKQIEGYTSYKVKILPDYENSTSVCYRFYTKETLSSSASNKFENVTFEDYQNKKYAYAEKISVTALPLTENVKLLYSYDDTNDIKTFKFSKTDGKVPVIQDKKVSVIAVKDGMYSSEIETTPNVYTTYMGTKKPGEKYAPLDLVFFDGSSTPSEVIINGDIDIDDDLKNNVQDAVYYVGPDFSDPSKEIILACYAHESLRTNYKFYNFKNSNVYFYDNVDSGIFSILQKGGTNGYEIWEEIKAKNIDDAGRFPAYSEYINKMTVNNTENNFYNYYLPTYTELSILCGNNIATINAALLKLGYSENNTIFNFTAMTISGDFISGYKKSYFYTFYTAGGTGKEIIGSGSSYILPIRRIDNTAQ